MLNSLAPYIREESKGNIVIFFLVFALSLAIYKFPTNPNTCLALPLQIKMDSAFLG